MNTLIFRIIPYDEDNKIVQYEPWDFSQITTEMWEQLAADFTHSPTLFPFPASVLARRCQEGFAAITIFENRIVSYIALAPIIHSGDCAPTWESLASKLNLISPILPVTNIYASSSGWTAKEWRGHGINLFLRKAIYSHYLVTPHLGVGGMVGLAQPLLAQLGWRIIGWDHVPFISSLVSLPASEFPVHATQSWHPPLGTIRYQGPHIGLDVTGHPWEKYIYLWVSDDQIAEELDQQIQTLVAGDLHGWRSIIADIYSQPDSMWKVAIDNC